MKSTNQASFILTQVIKVVTWSSTLLLIIFCYLNIRSYGDAVRLLFESNKVSIIPDFVINMPIFEYLIQKFSDLMIWILGAMLFALLKSLELLPSLMLSNRKVLRLVNEARVKHEDLPVLVRVLIKLKKVSTRLPYDLVLHFRNAATFASIADLILCFMVYRPIDGGVQQALLIIYIGAYQLIDWQNVIMLLFTLFAFNRMVLLLLQLSELKAHRISTDI